ncbi:hypothetical protein H2200_011879 [Cladophialophora chaetospira]|uniref:BTB domain-containing protein n=1 Tax=Cladophialophora chaetospira TaxID=386627 RepID=A0AA38WYY1_9EURO|nr:hypothetical protein H2200_011879 [Cladophialophora chaetospira]
MVASKDGDDVMSDFEEDAEFKSCWSGPTVRITVGSNAQVFVIHKDILIEASPVFKAMLSAGMIEQQTNEITLPEDPARAFNILMVWAYGRNPPACTGDEDSVVDAILTWKMADKYAMPQLQNVLIDELKEHWKQFHFYPRYLSWAVRNLPDTSELYKFLFDQLTYKLANRPYSYQLAPQDSTLAASGLQCQEKRVRQLENLLSMGEDSAKLFWAVQNLEKGKGSPARLEGCHYHVHADGEECPQEDSTSTEPEQSGADI